MSSAVSRGKQVFANTIAGFCGNTGSAIVGLALTPYLIYRLGFEAYGFWIVLSTVVNYVGLVDFGIESTFIKYTAEYAATGQNARVRQVTTFGVAFYTILSVVMAPVALVIAPLLVSWMKVSPHLAAQGPPIFALVIVAFFLQSAGGVVGSVLGGIGALRLVSLTNFVSRVGYAIAAIVLCSRGMGIYGLLGATFIQIALATMMSYLLARQRIGSVFINPLRLEREVMKHLFKLGGWIQLTNLASAVTMETNRLIISIFVQTSAVTLFEVANKLTRTARSLPFTFLVALLPAVSALDATSEDDGVFNIVFVRASRYMNAVTVGLLGFIIAAADPITRAWLGHTYQELLNMIAVLGTAYIVSNMTQVGTTMLRATGKPRYEAFLTIWSAVASIAAMFVFVPRFGALGVALAMLAGSIVGTSYFIWVFYRLRRLSVMSGFIDWYSRLAISGFTATALTLWGLPALHLHVFATRIGAALTTGIEGLIYLTLFVLGLKITHFFTLSDWSGLRVVLPAPMRRFLPGFRKGDAPVAAA